jgi:hypothetical protein
LAAILEVDRSRLFEKLGHSSSFDYCVRRLGLSEDLACSFLSVARKSQEVPELKIAVEEGLPISKAKKIVPVITAENQAVWVEKAKESNYRELEKEIAKEKPEEAVRERVKPLSESVSKLEVSLRKEALESLRRAQDLLSSKRGRPVSLEEVLGVALKEYVERHDPLKKAERARKPLAAHAVHQRDQGRCQARDGKGELCGQRRWLQRHHIQPRSQGGTDRPENLVTLCAFHHRLLHRKDTPLLLYPSRDG